MEARGGRAGAEDRPSSHLPPRLRQRRAQKSALQAVRSRSPHCMICQPAYQQRVGRGLHVTPWLRNLKIEKKDVYIIENRN